MKLIVWNYQIIFSRWSTSWYIDRETLERGLSWFQKLIRWVSRDNSLLLPSILTVLIRQCFTQDPESHSFFAIDEFSNFVFIFEREGRVSEIWKSNQCKWVMRIVSRSGNATTIKLVSPRHRKVVKIFANIIIAVLSWFSLQNFVVNTLRDFARNKLYEQLLSRIYCCYRVNCSINILVDSAKH